MLSNEQMISLMVNEPSWEDVLVRIVAEEGMDVWAIDLVRLADLFVEYMDKISELDLRIPARFILIAAIMLRMKSDILAEKPEKILIPESPENPKEAELLRALAAIPPLQPPAVRIPMKSVALNELITALRKAFEVRERRLTKRQRARQIAMRGFVQEEDITDRINSLLQQIESALQEIDRIEFSKIVKEWNRDNIVKTLLPMLHLAQNGKLTYDQPQLFEEFFVRLKKADTTAAEELP